MLSQKLHNAINAQVNAELWSAYLYLAMSLDAEAKGYKGVANWFYIQFQEEQAHDYKLLIISFVIYKSQSANLVLFLLNANFFRIRMDVNWYSCR